ncbi:MAG: hypothetical protein CM15mP83_6390 [Flavobacteriaceae bacterium]|nr:MAG: hypothetical protein CM15mP83_6390 [Flavobacteriaceae bacterium]
MRCRLETGRTHQIRAHMKHIGHTLFGDARYGGDNILKGTTFTKYKQFVDNCFKLLPRLALQPKRWALFILFLANRCLLKPLYPMICLLH